MVEKLFELWNATDDISAAPDLFATKAEAEQYAKEFRVGYARQGYYKTAGGWRIDPADVELVIRSVDVEGQVLTNITYVVYLDIVYEIFIR